MAHSAQGINPFDLAAGTPSLAGELSPKPRLADRISWRVLVVILLVLAAVVALFIAALDAMEKRPDKKAAAEAQAAPKAHSPREQQEVTPPEVLGSKPAVGPSLVLPTTRPDTAPLPGESLPQADRVPALGTGGRGNAADPIPPEGTGHTGLGEMGASGQAPKKTPDELAREREREDRLQRMEQARKQGLSLTGFKTGDDADLPNGTPTAGAPTSALNNALLSASEAANAARLAQAVSEKGGDSEQQQKVNFLKNAGNDYKSYHQHTPQPARSQNELKGGSFIRMSLQYGINSDLPGEVLARVTEDVYDTITGCRLLIPGMSIARGKYDSKVALGQGRNLVTWTALTFPDGSELNLGSAQGYDMSGAAGLDADVDNHYLRLFGLTFGMSLITAEVQMSAPQQTGNPGAGMTAQQSLAMALSQQYGQLGAQILGKYMAVQPTLRNYPGERFVVMVPATIVFTKVWRRRC